MWGLLVLACATEDIVPMGHPPLASLSCAMSPTNGLRASCLVTVSGPPREVSIRYDLGTETHVVDGALEVPIYGLRPGVPTEITLDVDGVTWTSTVEGTLPQEFDPVHVEVTSHGESELSYVLLPVECGATLALVIDGAGEVVWYEDLSEHGEQIVSIAEHPSEGILVTLDRRRLVDVAYDGTLRRNWGQDVLGEFVHHEAFVQDDVLWALTAEEWIDPVTGLPWVADGVRGFDADGGVVAEWDVTESFALSDDAWRPSPGYWAGFFPDAFESLHTNSASLTEDGWYFSFKYPSTVVQLGVADDGSPGELLWTLDGSGRGAMSLPEEATFAQQHHFRRRSNGLVGLFDNGEDGQTSRAIELDLAEDKRGATLAASYELPVVCEISGSLFGMPDSNHVLVTCADHHRVFEFTADGSLVWEALVQCDLDVGRPTLRAIPIEDIRGRPPG